MRQVSEPDLGSKLCYGRQGGVLAGSHPVFIAVFSHVMPVYFFDPQPLKTGQNCCLVISGKHASGKEVRSAVDGHLK